MGTSFVSIKEKGFWMNDYLLELWLRLLALHIEEPLPEEANPEVYAIRNNWLFASHVHFGGAVPDMLEEAVSTDNGKKVVLVAINSLLDSLSKITKKIDGPTLNLLGIGEYGEFDPDYLIDIGKEFIELIEGRVTTTAKDAGIIPKTIK